MGLHGDLMGLHGDLMEFKVIEAWNMLTCWQQFFFFGSPVVLTSVQIFAEPLSLWAAKLISESMLIPVHGRTHQLIAIQLFKPVWTILLVDFFHPQYVSVLVRLHKLYMGVFL